MNSEMTRAEAEHLAVHVELCGQRYERMERRLARIERVLYAVIAAIMFSGGMSTIEFARVIAMLGALGPK
jgi:hypothetical protein